MRRPQQHVEADFHSVPPQTPSGGKRRRVAIVLATDTSGRAKRRPRCAIFKRQDERPGGASQLSIATAWIFRRAAEPARAGPIRREGHDARGARRRSCVALDDALVLGRELLSPSESKMQKAASLSEAGAWLASLEKALNARDIPGALALFADDCYWPTSSA